MLSKKHADIGKHFTHVLVRFRDRNPKQYISTKQNKGVIGRRGLPVDTRGCRRKRLIQLNARQSRFTYDKR
jgi:hypothetical protein